MTAAGTLLCALALAAAAESAPAAPAPRLEVRDGTLVAALDLGPAFPDALERQLGNGLTNVVAIHVALVPSRGGEPAAVWAREIQLLYDVWDETYGVLVRDAGAPRGRRLHFANWPELRRYLSGLRGAALGPVSALGRDEWVLQARVELNPVSRELLERTRELIANPAAGTRGGPSRSVLGAIASYLLREPPPGADVRVLRSAPFRAADARAR